MATKPKHSLTTSQQPAQVKPLGVTFRNSEDEWYSDHEDDLIDIWHLIQDNINKRGIIMLDKCRFNHFCAFVLHMTTTQSKRCIEF